MLELVEHSSEKYSPRTYVNAKTADLTIAFAVDFDTYGEKATHKAAGGKYLSIDLRREVIESARSIYRKLKSENFVSPVLNIAGNGIYTLSKHGFCQNDVNEYVYEALKKVHEFWPVRQFISGGQTGVDISGAVAAELLNVDCKMMFPKGFLQRNVKGVDEFHTKDEIFQQVQSGVSFLRKKTTPVGYARVASKRHGGSKPDADETKIDGDRSSPVFGNPFILHDWKDINSRVDVINKYKDEVYIPDVLSSGPIYREMVKISDRVRNGEKIAIMCWCSPMICHCDHIADGINRLAHGEDIKKMFECKSNDPSYTFFYGKDSPFSNFYESPFIVDSVKFLWNEQYIMYKKASLFGDDDAKNRILSATNPFDCKKIGREVMDYRDDVWLDAREDVAFVGALSKFTQSEFLKDVILGASGTRFVEASPYDVEWGIGLSISDKRIFDEKKWRGKNLMGKVLDRVLEKIEHDMNLVSDGYHR